ncbi:Flp pilus assembly complex ATPase component [Parapusillimonas sp. SGNA-6]|nr:Flp pilus assembly complex ATPase component [Parapusillimonas sp. SGNA-6]
MINVELRYEDGTREDRSMALPVLVGRTPDCTLRLKGWRVARRHARFERRDGDLYVEDFGALSGTTVNGQRVALHGPLAVGDEIVIGPCLILIRDIHDGGPASGCPNALERPFDGQPRERIRIHALDGRDAAGHSGRDRVYGPDGPVSGRDPIDGAGAGADAGQGGGSHGGCPSTSAQRGHAPVHRDAGLTTASPSYDTLLRHRRRLHAVLLEALDLRRRDISGISDEALRREAHAVLAQIIQDDTALPASTDRGQLLVDVVNEAVGLGPLEPLLADDGVSEIMVNRHDEIFVESQGRLSRYPGGFSSEQAVLGVIERIVSPLGRRVDESSPMVDARLRDGSRVNAVIPPISLRGASLTIRKFPRYRPGMDDLLRMGTLDAAMRDFLSACVVQRKNVIVSGGTGSGKTTLLNVLSNCIPDGERIVTIEDAAELRLNHRHLVALESRPANLEGRGKIDIRDLVRNALRMRPDRIVIGECRGGEAFDMLAAMNTGHEGSLTTLHANSPRDALARLETMILMAGMDLPLSAVREHIAASIDVIVQQSRLSDGRRLITAIVEITGMESGRIQSQTLFRYVRTPVPAFAGCGVAPECFMDEEGAHTLPATLFDRKTPLPREGASSW